MDKENLFLSADRNQTVRQINARFVEIDHGCQQAINELRKIEKFLEDFCFLTFGRDFVFGAFNQNTICFSLNNVMTSLELTMGSMIDCCESACIADANTLLRKYRDDLFFYLYLSVYNSFDADSEKAKSMAAQITRWLKNDLSDFQIGQVLKAVATAPQLKDAAVRYHLKESFQEIGVHLNNYVHSNGQAYYNRNVNAYRDSELAVGLRKLGNYARYMTVTFLLLLIFCSPVSVMSEDYIDYLDFNTTPPENSQYWVAPFVEHFVKENISLIDANCLEYLRENTMMQF